MARQVNTPQTIFREKLKSFYVGDEAQQNREILSLNYPIERGVIVNWDNMEKIWNYALSNKLSAKTDHNPILLTQPALNPEKNKEKT